VTGTQRIRQLVQDLSTFSRQDQVERHRVAVVGGLRSTLNLVRAEFVHSVTFHLALNANPEVECWPALLNQVFMNVIVNACQAIRTRQQTNSSIVGELRISSRIDSGHLVIEFVDNGCGMSDSQMKRMFEPFYTTKEIGSGTGLGLYISNDIMEKHNGRFNVNSVLGEGTTFQLRLPLAANVTSLQTVLDAEA
jgi:signal transduction histidine kinase